jgi:DNA-binding NarL/FixJ family response regulator
MTTRPISIMIVDDHVVIRSGLRMLIEHDQRMRVVAQAGNKAEALERAVNDHPDVIILDLVLGDEDGL